jgi:hypothetical protein
MIQMKRFLNLSVVAAVFCAAQMLPGQTWQSITNNLPVPMRGDARAMATDGTRLYVLTLTNGVYVSSDNGNSFTPVNNVEGGVYSMMSKPGRFIKYANGSMWVGWDPGSAAIGGNGPINYGAATLHRLTPGETVWHKSSTGFPVADVANVADDIAYDASTATYYVASSTGGAYVSSDGSNWQRRTTGLGGGGVPVTMVAFDGMAFEASLPAQVARTANQGTNWTGLQSHQGFSTGLMIEKNGRLMFISNGPDRFNYSDDHGDTWHFTTNGVKQLGDLYSKDGLIYASGLIYGSALEALVGRPGLKFSATEGISWDNLPTNGLPLDVGSLNMVRVVRQGNYLFGYFNINGPINLYRCDVSGFDFRPTTQFIQQPPSTNYYIVGDTLNFTAQAVGLNVTYQWRFNGTNIDGATSTNLSFGPLQTTNSGTYSLVATGDRNSVTNSSVVNVVARQDGVYDITFHNPTTGGQTFVLSDGSMIAVTTISIFKFSPNGTLVTNRTISGANFTANFLDSSNRLVLTSTTSSGVNRLRRIKTSDLTDDATFDQITTERYIASVAELPGRGYVVGGWFTRVTNSAGNRAANQIFLTDYSGTLDNSFPGGAGPGYTFPGTPQINKVMIAGGTNIYVSGSFNLWNGQTIPVTPPFRLFADGTFNTNFSTLGFNGAYFYQPYPGGKILLVNGNSQPKLANVDGSLDPSFNPSNSSFNIAQNVVSVALGESNKIYIAGNGQLTSYAGHNVGKYLRLNSDGTFDSTFVCTNGPSTGGGFTWVSYDPRGFIYLTRDSTGGNFQGQVFGAGPYRLFAGVTAATTTTNGFDTWAAQFTFPPGKNNPGDDADGDGIANVFEFYFGSNPTVGASGKAPAELTVNSGGQNYPAITFIRSKTAGGVTLIPQASTSATFNNLLSTTVESVVDLGNGTEQVTIRSTTAVTAQPHQFLRILLSVP